MENLAAKLFKVYATCPEQHELTKFLNNQTKEGDFFPPRWNKEKRRSLSFGLVCSFANIVEKPLEASMVDNADSRKVLFNLVLTDTLREAIKDKKARMQKQPVMKEFWLKVTRGIEL